MFPVCIFAACTSHSLAVYCFHQLRIIRGILQWMGKRAHPGATQAEADARLRPVHEARKVRVLQYAPRHHFPQSHSREPNSAD